MVGKNKVIKVIDIIYWGIILITTFTNAIKSIYLDFVNAGDVILNDLTAKQYIFMICMIFLVILFNFISAFIKNLQLTLIYVGIKIAIKRFYKDRLDKIDLKQYENYYRDVIKEYSPAVLNYIDNFTIDDNTLVSTLMSLQLKGKINEEYQIVNENVLGLDENEKYIYENVSNLQNINFGEFKTKIIEDCKRHELIKEKQLEKNRFNKKFKILIFIIIVSALLFPLSIKVNIPMISIIIFFIELGGIIAIPIMRYYSITYLVMNSIEPYIRSKKAQEINEKLEGLKNYLKEYSNIKEKTQQELVIWEDYLIYSVIFNQNEKIIKEYQEKIDRM